MAEHQPIFNFCSNTEPSNIPEGATDGEADECSETGDSESFIGVTETIVVGEKVYEREMMHDGRSKRRPVGARQWQYYCIHNTQQNKCKECGGTSICVHGVISECLTFSHWTNNFMNRK